MFSRLLLVLLVSCCRCCVAVVIVVGVVVAVAGIIVVDAVADDVLSFRVASCPVLSCSGGGGGACCCSRRMPHLVFNLAPPTFTLPHHAILFRFVQPTYTPPQVHLSPAPRPFSPPPPSPPSSHPPHPVTFPWAMPPPRVMPL